MLVGPRSLRMPASLDEGECLFLLRLDEPLLRKCSSRSLL